MPGLFGLSNHSWLRNARLARVSLVMRMVS
jgi:hypothetical protein